MPVKAYREREKAGRNLGGFVDESIMYEVRASSESSGSDKN
jgi:hypothetical protein